MNKLLIPCFIIVCLLFTACSKDEASHENMLWSIDNQSTENIKSTYTSDEQPTIHLEADYKGGDVVLTCQNYDLLNPLVGNSNTYDCKWATITTEANQVKIHFPYNATGAPAASVQITISTQNEDRMVNTILSITRTFGEGLPNPEPEPLPEEYKFKLKLTGFTPFMHDDSKYPAPFELLIFRITDIKGNDAHLNNPYFTEYYDSIVWSANDLPNTVRIYERKSTPTRVIEEHFTSKWGSFFFKTGAIKTYLKGYREGKVEYVDELSITLFKRDFLCFDWRYGSILVSEAKPYGVYCLLDSKYEYQIIGTQSENGVLYSRITPWNNNQSDTDFLLTAQEAIKKLMKDNVGDSQKADGKEKLFKCLPTGVEAKLFWENTTTRMLLVHQLPEELVNEKYFLHIEAKE